MKNLLIVIFFTLGCITSCSLFSNDQKYRYLVGKYIDTVEVQGRYVRDGTYGLEFYIVYQEDKTMERFNVKVSKYEYDNAVVSVKEIIKFD